MDNEKPKKPRKPRAKPTLKDKPEVEKILPATEEPHPNQKVTDEEIQNALIVCNGQPVKASEMLNITYPALYLRIRKNPTLKATQTAYRARTHNDMTNLAMRIAVFGLIKEPKVDDDGNVIDGEFRDRKVDYGTRTNVILKLADMYKGEDGVIDNINIVSDGEGVNIGDWLAKMQEERNKLKK